jgi:hypothetical protein
MVKEEADYARTEFGRLAREVEHKQTNPNLFQHPGRDQRQPFRRSVNLTLNPRTTTDNKDACLKCNQSHKLDVCQMYLSLTLKDRWSYLRDKGCCFRCLQAGHLKRDCLSKINCSINGCGKDHHDTLHQEVIPQSQGSCNRTSRAVIETAVGVIPVTVVGPKGQIIVNALIDNGSNVTLLSETIRNRLGIEGDEVNMKVETLTGDSNMLTKRCEFTIVSLDGRNEIVIENAHTVNFIPKATSSQPENAIMSKWSHLNGIEFQGIPQREIDLLIGCDVPEAHIVMEQRFGGRREPYALKTKLGWILFGPIGSSERKTLLKTAVGGDRSIQDMITNLYNKDFEDMADSNVGMSIDERTALEIVQNSCKFTNGKYTVVLPWRSSSVVLPNNRFHALKRLLSLKGRFTRDPNLFEKYEQIIQLHLKKGYIEHVGTEDRAVTRRTWYLPHHPVIHPKKPGKVRIVFDCAAKFKGTSLNDNLLSGPDTTSNLVGILLRFRRYPVALAADIEEMFLQVQVANADRDSLRFLWWTKGDMQRDPSCYRIKVHPFGATSSPFCANFALKQAVNDFGRECTEETRRIACKDMYVDDCIASVRTVEEAKMVVNGLVNIFRSGGFRLRKWVSNYRDALVEINDADLSNENLKISDRQLPLERTLGIEWDANRDKFQFQFQCSEKAVSRRGLLSCVSSIFDPLGMVAPFIIPAKMILQDVCRKGKGWDASLDEDDIRRWTTWKKGMNQLECIDLDRCVFNGTLSASMCQLHVFADASERAYGAVAYVRQKTDEGSISSKLLMSKARVAPLKTVTIPRLELTAAVLAVRLVKCILTEFDVKFDKIILWTDSVLVLRYIRNTSSRFCTFVANRVQEILESTKCDQWRHVESKMNPADIVSRGMQGTMKDSSMWFEGPLFLREEEETWPTQDTLPDGVDGLELKKIVLTVHVDGSRKPMDLLIDHYSSWIKMKRAVAWLRRFKDYIKLMAKGEGSIAIGPLKCDELNDAERDITRYVQEECFHAEYKQLCSGSAPTSSFNWKASSLRKLQPFSENGLLRVRGRLQLADWDYESKHPIILPKNHQVTRAIVDHYHVKEGHSGVAHVLANIRRKYWIIQGGATIKRVLQRCLICKRLNATPMQQQMAPLPVGRVKQGWYPFQYTGVDYFGPFQVKRGRSMEKRYGCLFTCLQCRAVHIEVAYTMTTDSFLMALKRFMDKHGLPKEIYSDNGSNFVGCEREIKDWLTGLSQSSLTERIGEYGVKWCFNPPHASHRGGIWERLIRSIRRVLSAISWQQGSDEETLITYLSHAQRILNDRPITTVTDNVGEPSPLRPSDLLRPRAHGDLLADTPIETLTRKRWRIVNNLTSTFWKRWRSEYLPALQSRQKWLWPSRAVKIGDLVNLVTDQAPKGTWPLGLVQSVHEDGDGMIRTVDVKTKDGIVRRDIRKVCLLEGVG